jgi:hypothetical protein
MAIVYCIQLALFTDCKRDVIISVYEQSYR